MKILDFRANKVYGYLDFNIKFKPSLTFLTGINGSGKTTVVRILSSLISPSLVYLAYLDYEAIEVNIRHDKKNIKIWTNKYSDRLILCSSETDEQLEMMLFPQDEDIYKPPSREDKQLEYYRKIETDYANHPVIKLIKSLPSPMLLGIERRSRDLFTPEDRSTYIPSRYILRGRTRNILGNTLYESLFEARDLAADRYRSVQHRNITLTTQLRKNILMAALEYTDLQEIETRNFKEIRDAIFASEDQVVDTLLRLGLPSQDVKKNITSYIKTIRRLSNVLEDEDDLSETLRSGNIKKRAAASEWIVNYPHFNRIIKISNYIADYIDSIQRINEHLDRYLKIANEFLYDSKKKLLFNNTGELIVNIGNSHNIQITDLSSGESQLVVIITHLMFNPAAQLENVFIIDEPELSLHLRWQELFVNAIRNANPRLQIIFATHSPSIILDKTRYCIDLSESTT